MNKYKFYASDDVEGINPVDKHFAYILNQKVFYDILSNVWSKNTCAPRMQDRWSKENNTVGQCSITAFLVQDIFGGEVYGIPLESGGVHCFNNVDGHIFDLASEQFGDKVLDYVNVIKQERESHFSDEDKFNSYKYLWDKLNELYLN